MFGTESKSKKATDTTTHSRYGHRHNSNNDIDVGGLSRTPTPSMTEYGDTNPSTRSPSTKALIGSSLSNVKPFPVIGNVVSGAGNINSSSLPTVHASTVLSRDHQFHHQQFRIALTMAGTAASLLVTIFGLFHVDVFLRVYRLPLHSYSTGNIVFSIVNTTNDLLGAWLLDYAATKMARCDLIGISGCFFAVCFLAPFFRWNTEPSQNEFFDMFHFILSMSLYDTLYSFTAILQGSLVTDNHHLTDQERVNFMASGKVVNLIASFAVGRIGLFYFDEDNVDSLGDFRMFLLVLAAVVAVIFILAQIMTHFHVIFRWKSMSIRLTDMHPKKDGEDGNNKPTITTSKLKPRQVMKDFWKHNNFWAWIGMEVFLESQNSFSNAFMKTFVDRLVHDQGVSRELCDWLLSTIRPLGLICGILCYIPIRKVGYKKLYSVLFATNITISLYMLFFASHTSTGEIVAYLLIYPAITGAVASSGFHLVMSDMVLQMKHSNATDQRLDDPSLAALFMGVNALFCKPAESLLPVIAANVLDTRFHDLSAVEGSEDIQKSLYKLLIVPPLVFSFFQWASWRRYTLTPDDTQHMRDDLRKMELINRRISNDSMGL
mmetsp:Transcript_24383/g.57782  ORF Transcript_24383/g.57782 Transcript_24383/m.57782 type:complete len:602 (+) Transcript_24383:276-2081(+)